jgi:hypothetical protein
MMESADLDRLGAEAGVIPLHLNVAGLLPLDPVVVVWAVIAQPGRCRRPSRDHQDEEKSGCFRQGKAANRRDLIIFPRRAN